MELTISEEQAKDLLKEALVELIEEKRDLFYEVMLEAIEEVGLANAIREGRQDEFVSEEQVLAILRGQAYRPYPGGSPASPAGERSALVARRRFQTINAVEPSRPSRV